MFLVLTLIIFMAEPGDCGLFGGIKAMWRGARKEWKAHRKAHDMRKMARKYGSNWQQEGSDNSNNGQAPADYQL